MSLLELFCQIDDFCQEFDKDMKAKGIGSGLDVPGRKSQMCLSEIMTIVVYFHQSRYRDFKAYYIKKVQVDWKVEFPGLVSYKMAPAISIFPAAGSRFLDANSNNLRCVTASFDIYNHTDINFDNLVPYTVNVTGISIGGTGIIGMNDGTGAAITDEAKFRAFEPDHG